MVKYEASLDHTFGALADSTRRAILLRLAGGDCHVSELAEPFSISLPAISKHIRVLERAGLVVRRKEGRNQRCQFVADPLKEATEWTGRHKRFWEGQLDRLAAHLEEKHKRVPSKQEEQR